MISTLVKIFQKIVTPIQSLTINIGAACNASRSMGTIESFINDDLDTFYQLSPYGSKSLS